MTLPEPRPDNERQDYLNEQMREAMQDDGILDVYLDYDGIMRDNGDHLNQANIATIQKALEYFDEISGIEIRYVVTRAARATGTGTRRANPGVDGVAPRIRLTREATHADISTARGDSVSSRATRRVYKYFLTLTRDADGRASVLRKHEFTLKARYRLPRRRVFPLRVRVVLRLRRPSLGGLAFPV